jgi:hypothetical protein
MDETTADNNSANPINMYVFFLPYLFCTRSRKINVAPIKNVPIGTMKIPITNGANAAVITLAVTIETKYNNILTKTTLPLLSKMNNKKTAPLREMLLRLSFFSEGCYNLDHSTRIFI